jgi:hypothetical protein
LPLTGSFWEAAIATSLNEDTQEAAAILPCQYYEKSNEYSAEKRMLFAMLEDAVHILIGQSAARTAHREFSKAAKWVAINDRTCFTSFVSICDVLGIDADAVRDALRHKNPDLADEFERLSAIASRERPNRTNVRTHDADRQHANPSPSTATAEIARQCNVIQSFAVSPMAVPLPTTARRDVDAPHQLITNIPRFKLKGPSLHESASEFLARQAPRSANAEVAIETNPARPESISSTTRHHQLSEAGRQSLSEASRERMRRQNADPEFTSKRLAVVRETASENMTRLNADREFRTKATEAARASLTQRWIDPESRAKILASRAPPNSSEAPVSAPSTDAPERKPHRQATGFKLGFTR